MTYRGRVKDGVVVLDQPGQLPEGAEVVIEFPEFGDLSAPVERDSEGLTVGERLMKHAGKAKGLPTDLARNHDHYLYGVPKK